MSQITLTDVSKSYGTAAVIDDLSLQIREGEFFTLLGPSGCGKTTTLRSIAGLETPDAGRIEIGDRVVTCMTTKNVLPPHRRRLGMVFQSYAIWPHLTVFDNVAYPLRRLREKPGDVRARVMRTLSAVGLDHLAHRSSTELSGGQQQRIALARAIVANPEVVLFDEPLSNLDAQLRISMRDEIQRVARERGMTSVYVTHDQSEAFSLSDRIAIMLDGRIAQLDTPEVVMNAPADSRVARFLGVENIFAASVVHVSRGEVVVLADAVGLRLIVPRASAPSVRVGEEVTVAFRAGAAKLVPAGEGQTDTSSTFAGTVIQSTFLGEGVQYRIASGAGHVLVRSHSSRAVLLDRATPVRFRVDPSRVSVLTR